MNDDFGPNSDDKLFDELDKLVESFKRVKLMLNPFDLRCDANLEMINLMIEEAPERDIRIYQQIGRTWVAEVKYHGINFVCVVGKTKPQFWDEVFDDK